VSFAIGENHARIVFRDAGNQADSIGEIGGFGRYDEGRVHVDGHRQLVASTIVDNAAARREVEAALLLVLRAALEIAVAEYLEINQANADDHHPQAEQSRQGVNTDSCAVGG